MGSAGTMVSKSGNPQCGCPYPKDLVSLADPINALAFPSCPHSRDICQFINAQFEAVPRSIPWGQT